ncbi:helix-turn-helix transcriptional regulator [Sphaerotilus sp.]|uniref:helix-turn-helix transcriptional regulator n=1 Tax=Sphaerotilus sp. TaxID=2093942 RepID=UPI0025E07844|nr:helix-turn-helix domain-containing protein [Sphaerotilus sp.]
MSPRVTPVTPPLAPLPADLAGLALLPASIVCAILGVGDQTLRDWIKAGKFPAADYRDGPRYVRWSSATVREWLAANAIKPTVGAK